MNYFFPETSSTAYVFKKKSLCFHISNSFSILLKHAIIAFRNSCLYINIKTAAFIRLFWIIIRCVHIAYFFSVSRTDKERSSTRCLIISTSQLSSHFLQLFELFKQVLFSFRLFQKETSWMNTRLFLFL